MSCTCLLNKLQYRFIISWRSSKNGLKHVPKKRALRHSCQHLCLKNFWFWIIDFSLLQWKVVKKLFLISFGVYLWTEKCKVGERFYSGSQSPLSISFVWFYKVTSNNIFCSYLNSQLIFLGLIVNHLWDFCISYNMDIDL